MTAIAMPAADIKTLQKAIEASGLSDRRFAKEVLIRDERTVRRWLAGKSPIPGVVLEFLREYLQKGGYR
jgi:hypothetical protein